jgi:WD40 repeat protein
VSRSSRGHGSNAKKGGSSGPQPVVVRDSQGNDVTPRSLLGGDTRAVPIGADGQPVGVPTEAGAAPTASMSASSGQSSAAAGPNVNVSANLFNMSSAGSDSDLSTASTGVAEDASKPLDGTASQKGAATEAEAAAAAAAEAAAAAARPLTEEELAMPSVIELCETEIFWLLDVPGVSVAQDSADAAVVLKQNEAYEALLRKRVDTSDMYTERAAQTLAGEKKVKEVQTPVLVTFDAGTQASAWDIHDVEVANTPDPDAAAELDPTLMGAAAEAGRRSRGTSTAGSELGTSADRSFSMSMAGGHSTSGASMSISGSVGASMAGESMYGVSYTMPSSHEPGTTLHKEAKEVRLESLEALPAALRTLERAVVQNNYHDQHLAYRNVMQPARKASGLQYLWGFACEQSQGRNVSCVEWNPLLKDLLVVAYGEFDFTNQKDGLILFWSLKNPSCPDKVLTAPCGVTCLAFSKSNPNLLAAGLYDGTVCIYDVRKPEDAPMLESGHTSGKHTDPAWGLKWVDEGKGQGEILVSISTDGRVTQWHMKKGLEHTDLMMLKRVTSAANTESSEGIISGRASGLCFDFCPRDGMLYVAGTEDGHLLKCSTSYNEQHLTSYPGHSGPVYKLRWSPFCGNTFLSCSADWTIKLWNQEKSEALFSFQPGADYVADISWAPDSSTIFASATGDGRLDLWDISTNTLDPLYTVQTKTKLSCVSFSPNSPVVVTGCESGSVQVYKLTGPISEPSGRTTTQQLVALEKITGTNVVE